MRIPPEKPKKDREFYYRHSTWFIEDGGFNMTSQCQCQQFNKDDLEILEDCCRFTRSCVTDHEITIFEEITRVLDKINLLLHNGQASYDPI